MTHSSHSDIPKFSDNFFNSQELFCRIGQGAIGGKAAGLFNVKSSFVERASGYKNSTVSLHFPKTAVITTDFFDLFLKENNLYKVAYSNTSDSYIAHEFQRAGLHPKLVEALKSIVRQTSVPLAIRSSSISEDATDRPFAGVFNTKMIPNNPKDDERFKKLLEAIKFVYASTFFKRAKDYYQALKREASDEKMAVIIQPCVGNSYGDYFYPEISGVVRSSNFYPTGSLRPSDGVANLAFGLGKTIVDGGIAWIYSPQIPSAPAPFNSTKELLDNTQTKFWAINLFQHQEYNPSSETEFIVNEDIIDAGDNDLFPILASTYDTMSDRVVMGTPIDGPRVIDFAPILKLEMVRLNEAIKAVMGICEERLNSSVEIEFAVEFDKNKKNHARFYLLQVRQMSLSFETIAVEESELYDGNNLVASRTVHGNGLISDICDVVYVRPDKFDLKYTQQIAKELESINSDFIKERKKYLLIGLGRWGSSDPLLGIPVKWAQISQARAIVETTQPGMFVEMSQGTHFFHNITSSHVFYFSVEYFDKYKIDWDWLDHRVEITETQFVKHVSLDRPLYIKVDGRTQRGVIQKFFIDRTIKEKDEISQKERRKELKCIYEVEKLLGPSSKSMDEVLAKVAEAMRSGWMYPEECVVQINYQNMQIGSSNFCSTSWCLQNELVASGRKVGEIKVCYLKELPATDVGPFLNEEVKLLENIGNLLAAYLDKYEGVAGDDKQKKGAKTANWKMALEMISKSDAKLLMLVTKKMLYQLCLSNNAKAQALLEQFDKDAEEKSNESFGDANVPLKKKGHFDVIDLRDEIFEIATSFFSDHEIFSFLDAWSQQHNANFLVDILSNQQSSMSDIINAISRYLHIYQNTKNLPGPTKRQLLVSLIGRFITTSPEYIRVAKNFFEIEDFLEILHFVITPTRGHGTIGGKGAGMFLAYKILSKESSGDFGTLKIPKTWYLSTDAFDNFIHHNNLGDLFEQKYRPIDQIRQEHPHIVQLFKSSPFSSDIIKGLTKALEDLGDLPLVVRSSSILEDSFTASFAGKYKSLFLANQGSRDQRLSALMDAIAEIYASTFAPDPISYRSERNLLDVKESMGIMIQAVVGQKVHDYYFPSLAGVMFSNNEFRWSKRIKRDDGLLRIVPGLGTRAVDRVSDDYPILIAPGQPGLRVNISVEEVARYSPKKIDLINLKKGTFETHDVYKILKELGYDYPKLKQIVSIYDRTRIYRPAGVDLDIENREMVVTFEGLFSDTNFIAQMKQYINQLKEVFEFPVDVEFAHDGNDFYLLQCRPQINGQDSRSIPIPKNISKERTLFSANKFISNGAIPDITHIVYVDPQSYSKVASIDDLIRVGEAIGLLNKILPKRRFILMGPGRWGSRGDIKLGVRTSYSDLNNTAVLIEIARKKGNYTPELSFGTHFFQDLVESSIRYIPLYPDDEEVDFNNDFFQNATNLLADLAPNYQDLSAVVRVIDVGQNSEGKILRIVMSSEEDRALGFLTYADDLTGHMEEAPPSPAGPPISASNFSTSTVFNVAKGNIYERSRWNWRMYMALELSKQLDRERFGVVDLYLIGSVKTETFDAESDIDLLVHFAGDEHQLCSLSHWLEGWSRCLGVMNYLYSGYRREELLDVKIVTDANIEEKYKYAVKIGAATDSALKLGGK